jgi:hypothetical protein
VPWVGGPEGLHHLEVFTTLASEPVSDGERELRTMVHAGWRLGARWLHTAVSLGTDGEDCMLRVGAGTEVDLDPVTFDVELGAHLPASKCGVSRLGDHPRVALGVRLGVRIFDAMALFAGVDVGVSTDAGDVFPEGVLGLRFFR